MPEQKDARSPVREGHALTLENRSRMTISGVTDVPSFCEQTIVAETDDGTVTVIGDGLHISRLNLGEGVVHIEGRVNALEYGDAVPQKARGIFGRLLK